MGQIREKLSEKDSQRGIYLSIGGIFTPEFRSFGPSNPGIPKLGKKLGPLPFWEKSPNLLADITKPF